MRKMLKELRQKRGYTQEYMAKKLGYKGKSSYCLLENGAIKLSIENAAKIAEILDVSPSIFFADEVEDASTPKETA